MYLSDSKSLYDALRWNEPTSKGKHTNIYDVTITKRTDSRTGKENCFLFTFRNGTYQKIAPKHGRLSFAVGFGVVAFKESENGWKLTSGGRTAKTTRYVNAVVNDKKTLNALGEMIGNYNLFEDELGFFYVTKGEDK